MIVKVSVSVFSAKSKSVKAYSIALCRAAVFTGQYFLARQCVNGILNGDVHVPAFRTGNADIVLSAHTYGNDFVFLNFAFRIICNNALKSAILGQFYIRISICMQ